MKKTHFLYLAFSLILSSCLRLDSNLYNLSDKISEYKRDGFTGTQDFRLDASYDIPDSLVLPLTLKSHSVKENRDYSIRAFFIGHRARIATDTVIVYCHGNKWHMDFYWQRAKLLAHVGGKNRYGVLYMDYRGYGLSEGTPSEEGLYEDVDACLNWLKQEGLNNERLIMYGFSMGTSAATELSSKPRSLTPHKLILEAPFASAAVMAADGAGLDMPSSFFTNLKIDNAEEIKQVKQPFLWMHGVNDLFLGIKTHGEVVFKNHTGSYKEAHRIDGADHGEVPATWGFRNYIETLSAFITKP
ncbi:MAG: alpha/beta hydrolase [Bacteroidetes bacterium]|nr:alpha/beta hydrolase [Bacteroidota bacterium]